MENTIQLLKASADILKLLEFEYDDAASRMPETCYPDHLIKPISAIENAALYDSASILYDVFIHDICVFRILQVIQYYPLALPIMCRYKGPDGKSTLQLMKEHEHYRTIKRMYPEMFDY